MSGSKESVSKCPGGWRWQPPASAVLGLGCSTATCPGRRCSTSASQPSHRRRRRNGRGRALLPSQHRAAAAKPRARGEEFIQLRSLWESSLLLMLVTGDLRGLRLYRSLPSFQHAGTRWMGWRGGGCGPLSSLPSFRMYYETAALYTNICVVGRQRFLPRPIGRESSGWRRESGCSLYRGKSLLCLAFDPGRRSDTGSRVFKGSHLMDKALKNLSPADDQDSHTSCIF